MLTPALLLLFSVAFCDYMTSGLENPLSYFLVGLLLYLIAAAGMDGLNDNPRYRRWIFLLLALLVLNRFDYAALLLPLALVLTMTSRGIRGFWHDVWPGALLLFGWILFALVYFGSPLPNTFYAKMASGYPLEKLLERGADYFLKTAHNDPMSFVIITAAIALSIVSGRRVLTALAAGQLLYLGFIIYAGGDWMPAGRFFAVPVLLAVGQIILALAERGRFSARFRWRVLAALLLAALSFGALFPRAHYPLLAAAIHLDAESPLGRYGHQRWGLFSMPRSEIVTQQRPTRYAVTCGFVTLHALRDADIWVIDLCAFTEPFLARLPGMDMPPAFTMANGLILAGHHTRIPPTNYGEYLVGNTDAIPDENLHGLLRDMRLASRAPALFTKERLSAIWRLNTGYHADIDVKKCRGMPRDIPLVSDDVRFSVRLDELDNTPKPDGLRMREAGVLPLVYNNLRVTLSRPRRGSALQLSLSDLEDYEIRVNGELIGRIEQAGADGRLKNHRLPLPRPMTVADIEIRAVGRYRRGGIALGHLFIR